MGANRKEICEKLHGYVETVGRALGVAMTYSAVVILPVVVTLEILRSRRKSVLDAS